MSIHVTVSSNPLHISRSKVLLTDIDLAKKNEWLRRRKLRLQQVRQQSRDLATNLRKKCDIEKQIYCKQEYEESERKLKQWQDDQLKRLQKEYDNCIAAVGTAHRTADCQLHEDDRNVKEKQVLRNALAKARGALAQEKAKTFVTDSKETCASAAKTFVSDSKETSAPTVRFPARKENVSKKFTRNPREAFSTTIQKTPAKNKEKFPPHKAATTKKDNKKQSEETGPTECTILSPGVTKDSPKKVKKVQRKVTAKVQVRQHSCSPNRKNTGINISICDDSDDSNATWPPRSARVTKMTISPFHKVKFYNHDERMSKEYVKPPKTVTHIENHNDEMEKNIQQEEEAVAEKTKYEADIKKRSEARGQEALNKERVEREFRTLTRQLAEVDKQKRIAKIYEYPYSKEPKNTGDKKLQHTPSKRKEQKMSDEIEKICYDEQRSKEIRLPQEKLTPKKLSKNEDLDQELKKCFEIGSLVRSLKHQTKSEQSKTDFLKEKHCTLKNLIDELEKERDLLLNSTIENSPKKMNEANSHNQVISKDSKNCKEQKSLEVQNIMEAVPRENIPLKDKNSKQNINNNMGEKTTHGKWPHPIEVNVITKPICKCETSVCERNSQRKLSDRDKNEISSVNQECDKCDFNETKKRNSLESKIYEEESKGKSKDPAISAFKEKSSSSSYISREESRLSSSSVEGIKVTVEVTEKERSKNKFNTKEELNPGRCEEDIKCNKQLDTITDNTNSSSSYFSPPSNLSPAQKDILNFILVKMCLKKKNPKLHKYITRLLSMSQASVENLGVSSSSEISVQSDLFANLKNIDPVTGTQLLSNHGKRETKTVTQSYKKEECKISKKEMKRVIQLTSSSEESTSVECSPISKDVFKEEKQPNLAEEYALRLRDLIDMLNQPATEFSEINGNESSSYLRPPLGRNKTNERRLSNETAENKESISSYYNNNTGGVSGLQDIPGILRENDRNVRLENVESSAYTRNNITSLGLPYELLPKPFTFSEEAASMESRPSAIPINKYNVDGHLPHELSTIPEVPSQSCIFQKESHFINTINENNELLEKDDCLSEIDILEVSSIKEFTPNKETGQNDVNDSKLVKTISETSSLSIISHMSNESLIDVGEDISSRDIHRFLESPSDYIEEVFRSLGVGWALSTLRKTRQSRQRDSASTSSASNGNESHIRERNRTKTTIKGKEHLRYSHSTPKKQSELQHSSESGITNEELLRRFNALKNDRMGLTPPDLSLNLPHLGGLINNNSDSSRSSHLAQRRRNY